MNMNKMLLNIFKDENNDESLDYISLEKNIKEKNDIENINVATKIAEMMLKTPVKDDESGSRINDNCNRIRSVKRTLRSSPYSKDKDVISEQKMIKNQESTETVTSKMQESSSGGKKRKHDVELDPGVLNRRQKQIDFGKNTTGYDNYIQSTPRDKRKPEDPTTPNKNRVYSRRGFDGLVKQWRLKLHEYDDKDTK